MSTDKLHLIKICGLCRNPQSDEITFKKLYRQQAISSHFPSILERHFWPNIALDTETNHDRSTNRRVPVCDQCYTMVVDFNDFYNFIENIHQIYIAKIEIETLKVTETGEVVENYQCRSNVSISKVDAATNTEDNGFQLKKENIDTVSRSSQTQTVNVKEEPESVDDDWSVVEEKREDTYDEYMNVEALDEEYLNDDFVIDSNSDNFPAAQSGSYVLTNLPDQPINNDDNLSNILYGCNTCRWTFRSVTDYNDHLTECERIYNSPISELTPADPSSGTTGKIIDDDSSNSILQKYFRCSICKLHFDEKKLWEQHKVYRRCVPPKVLFNRYCHICQREFPPRSDYNQHIQFHHTDVDLSVQCDICQTVCKNMYLLNIHMRVNHYFPPVKCHVCSKIYSHKFIKTHIKTVHTNKMHVCQLCGRSFKMLSAYKEHMSIHTGVHLYPCRFCDRSFRLSSEMYRHVKKYHLDEHIKFRMAGDKIYCKKTIKPKQVEHKLRLQGKSKLMLTEHKGNQSYVGVHI